jgi:dihydrodipicolinate synthase/N-acetylneuraminate lyase
MGNILPRLCAGLYDAYISGEMEIAQNYQRSIDRIDELYPDDSSIPSILKIYLARKEIIANPMSFIPYKGDEERIMSLFESTIGKLGLQGAL